jgi:molecular chaperone GrpE
VNPETNTTDNEQNGTDSGTADSATTPEIEQIRAERDELRDMLLRRQAEFDNFRKRTERERSEYLQWAGMEAVKDLLPVLDDFERAMRVEGGNPDYVKGVEMINTRMLNTLKKLGLEPIESTGKPFDPQLHQAIERVETTDAEDGTVLGEFQRGYNFKGKLLRPAMVRVAVNS